MTKAKEYPTMAEAYGMTEKELQAHLWEEELALDREYLLAKDKHEADIIRALFPELKFGSEEE